MSTPQQTSWCQRLSIRACFSRYRSHAGPELVSHVVGGGKCPFCFCFFTFFFTFRLFVLFHATIRGNRLSRRRSTEESEQRNKRAEPRSWKTLRSPSASGSPRHLIRISRDAVQLISFGETAFTFFFLEKLREQRRQRRRPVPGGRILSLPFWNYFLFFLCVRAGKATDVEWKALLLAFRTGSLFREFLGILSTST